MLVAPPEIQAPCYRCRPAGAHLGKGKLACRRWLIQQSASRGRRTTALARKVKKQTILRLQRPCQVPRSGRRRACGAPEASGARVPRTPHFPTPPRSGAPGWLIWRSEAIIPGALAFWSSALQLEVLCCPGDNSCLRRPATLDAQPRFLALPFGRSTGLLLPSQAICDTVTVGQGMPLVAVGLARFSNSDCQGHRCLHFAQHWLGSERNQTNGTRNRIILHRA